VWNEGTWGSAWRDDETCATKTESVRTSRPQTGSPLSPTWLARPPSWLSQHDHSHVHLHLLMSQMLATAASHLASWSLSPSLMSAIHYSRSIGTTRLYLTFTQPSTTASELHTYTTQAKRHVTHIAFAMVGLVTTQPSSWITLTITHHKTKHKGTFQPCVRTIFSWE
jgi:hypothetical protein